MADRHSATNEPPTRSEDAGKVQSHSGNDLLNVNHLFNTERRQILNARNIYSHRLRPKAIRYILERHSHFRFSPGTAYRALWYFDWFMTRDPASDRDEWYHVLAVACLSVAAKKLETQARIPSLEDLQGRPGRSYPDRTITNAERVVVERLPMHGECVTPVDFRYYFLSRLPLSPVSVLPPSPVPRPAVHTGQTFKFLVLKSIYAGTYLRFRPSELAAAAVILAARQRDVELPDAFYGRVKRVRVAICRQEMEGFLLNPCPCSDCAPPPILRCLPVQLLFSIPQFPPPATSAPEPGKMIRREAR